MEPCHSFRCLTYRDAAVRFNESELTNTPEFLVRRIRSIQCFIVMLIVHVFPLALACVSHFIIVTLG